MNRSPVLLTLAPAEPIGAALARLCGYEPGTLEQRRFPDGESYVRVASDVTGRTVVLVASLNDPDGRVPALLFTAATCRELGAAGVVLVAPYLPYMRQDRRFRDGEALAARLFASLLSSYVDSVVTVAPHLHRIADLSEIFPIETHVAPATDGMADWIAGHVRTPLVVGPDVESAQWVSEVARLAHAPWVCLRKTRSGDRSVTIEPPPAKVLQGRTPVLVDDIISTATTMVRAVHALREAGAPAPVCMAIHALFAAGAEQALRVAGARQVVTCDTIAHPTNAVSILPGLARTLVRAVESRPSPTTA